MEKRFIPEGVEEVSAALEILLESMEGVLDEFNQKSAEILAQGDYHAARGAIEKGVRLESFRDNVKKFQGDWKKFWNGRRARGRKGGRKLARGLRTPQENFVLPILEVLEELGGRGEAGKVIDLVGEKVGGELNSYDRELLASTKQPRWRNTVQWCRYDLVKEGLLDPNSPHGVWVLTEKGREFLSRARKSDL